MLATVIALLALVATPVAAGADNDDNNGGRSFAAQLSGDSEVPPVTTDTSGRTTFKANRHHTELRFKMRVRNADTLLGVAGAHIHCAPAGENGPVAAFLAGAVPGGLQGKVRVEGTLTDANVIATDCGANLAELIQAMRAGDTYVNVHSTNNPGGEVRGQIHPRGGSDD